MWHNKLTKIDSLRKMYAPRLKYIDVSSNYISEWSKYGEMTSKNIESINSHKNLLSYVDHLMKNIDLESNCMINIIDNKLVKVYGHLVNKEKKRGKIYYVKDKTLSYV